MNTSRHVAAVGRRFTHARAVLTGLALCAALIPASPAAETALYFLRPLHLHDAEHTDDNGRTQSISYRVAENGIVAGYSWRFADVPPVQYPSHGFSAWLADPHGRTMRVGLGGGVNNAANLYTELIDLNARGTAIGLSTEGPARMVWMANLETGTTRLDAFLDHNAMLVDLNDEDWLVGYVDSAVDGRRAYLAQGNEPPVRVGLWDAAHTSSDGRQMSLPAALNNARQVIGTAVRYNGGDPEGPPATAWFRYPDGEYWLPGGTTGSSRAVALTESGFFGLINVAAGESVSLHVGHASRTLRLVGEGTGFERIAENGAAVVSTAEWYRGSPVRRENWLNTAAHGTVQLGLSDYLYANGVGVDTVVALTESGLVAGTTQSRESSSGAWVADMAGTITKIGLYGPDYTWSDSSGTGRHSSSVRGATESGLVWGGSVRSFSDNGPTRIGGGELAWVYNVHTRALQTFPFPTNSNNNMMSRVHRVLENGTVLGTYQNYELDDYTGHERVFLWIPGEGLVLLDQRIDVSAAEAGFAEGYGPLHDATADGVLIGSVQPVYHAPDGAYHADGMYAVQLGGEPPPPPPEPGDLHYTGRLGFYDAAHTGQDGLRLSGVVKVTETGYTVGMSRRPVGSNDVPASPERTPQSAWLGTPDGLTRRIGFSDALHTRDDGRQESRTVDVNNGGVTIGSSTRFGGHAYGGESAWVADRHGTTLKVGYYDAAHTGSGGVKISRAVDLNNHNQLVGYSLHPDTEASTAWLATSTGAITRLTLGGPGHTAPDGTRVDLPVALNDRGFIVGVSEQYVPGVAGAGLTPWLRLPSGTMRVVGLQTGVHQAANGLHRGTVEFLSENTRVAGHATRYRTGTSARVGQSAWLCEPSQPNRPVGYATGLHAGANNVAFSRIMGLSALGVAMGYSTQYPAGATSEDGGRGRTAWIASIDSGTIRVGLYGAANSSGPFQFNHVRAQNRSGEVVGTAARYAAGQDRGLDGWFATLAGATRRLRLPDARYRRSDGYERHVPTVLTDSRRIAGISARYSGALEVGQSAWIYDVATQVYATIDLSVRATDQFAWSVVTELREDGSAFGLYRKFGADGRNLGDRAFMYLPGVGAFDVEAALDVTPVSRGWAFLGKPVRATAGGQIVGLGQLADRQTAPFSQGVYLLQE